MQQQGRAAGQVHGAGAKLRRRRIDGGDIIWVDGLPSEPAPEWFDPHWLAAQGLLEGEATGRGTTHFVRIDGQPLALRHYRRGGVFGDLLEDRYLWTGLRATRAWRELSVQARLHELGLPVPRPVAARVLRPRGVKPFYRADLLTGRIADAVTLSQRVARTPLDQARWREVGAVVARFHAAGLEHADLNAHNIMIGGDGVIYLIDFDRARLHAGPGKWAPRNLVRLRRSLDKLKAATPGFHFTDEAWDVLTVGYESARLRASSAGRTSSTASR